MADLSQPPNTKRSFSRVAALLSKLADFCRKRFDAAPSCLSPSAIVAFLAACAALTGGLQLHALKLDCTTPPDLVRLEVAFTAPSFRATLKSADVVVHPIKPPTDGKPDSGSKPV